MRRVHVATPADERGSSLRRGRGSIAPVGTSLACPLFEAAGPRQGCRAEPSEAHPDLPAANVRRRRTGRSLIAPTAQSATGRVPVAGSVSGRASAARSASGRAWRGLCRLCAVVSHLRIRIRAEKPQCVRFSDALRFLRAFLGRGSRRRSPKAGGLPSPRPPGVGRAAVFAAFLGSGQPKALAEGPEGSVSAASRRV